MARPETRSVLSKPTQNARPNVDVLAEYGNQRLADVESGGVVPEAESCGDMSVGKVLRGIVGRGAGNADDQSNKCRLKRNIADPARAARCQNHR